MDYPPKSCGTKELVAERRSVSPTDLSGAGEEVAAPSLTDGGPSWHEQDTTLREMWMKNQSPALIAQALGRSVSAVMTRAARLGLPRRFAPGRKPGVRPAEGGRPAPSRNAAAESEKAAVPATQTSPRVCLMCLNKFQSLGRHNRICSTCKNSSEYESGSSLAELALPVE